MHVNTGASLAMFDISRVAEMMSMSVESLLVPFITRLQMSLHVASSKSQRGSTTRQSLSSANTDCWHCVLIVARCTRISVILSVKCVTKQSANAPGPSSLFGNKVLLERPIRSFVMRYISLLLWADDLISAQLIRRFGQSDALLESVTQIRVNFTMNSESFVAPFAFGSSNLLPHPLQVIVSPRLPGTHIYRSSDNGCMLVDYGQKLRHVLFT